MIKGTKNSDVKSYDKKLRAYTYRSYMSLTDGSVIEFLSHRIYGKYCKGLNREVKNNGNR